MRQTKTRHGFTLIELLVVIGIIAILAAIVAIAVNPGRQYGQARDAQRWSDINAVINSIHQYAADHNGAFPAGIPAIATPISSTVGDYNLCTYIVPTYIATMPFDPSASGAHYTNCTDYASDYTIELVGGRVKIVAPSAEHASVTLTR